MECLFEFELILFPVNMLSHLKLKAFLGNGIYELTKGSLRYRRLNHSTRNGDLDNIFSNHLYSTDVLGLVIRPRDIFMSTSKSPLYMGTIVILTPNMSFPICPGVLYFMGG